MPGFWSILLPCVGRQCSSAVEQRFRKPSVAGSIPAIGSILRGCFWRGCDNREQHCHRNCRFWRSFMASGPMLDTPCRLLVTGSDQLCSIITCYAEVSFATPAGRLLHV